MSDSTDELTIKIDLGPEAPPEEAEDLTRSLREELLQLGVDDVQLVSAEEAPEGAKGFGLLEVGALVIKFATSDALKKVIGALRSWVTRDEKRSVKLVVAGESIEMTGVTGAQQQQLIDEWVRVVARKIDA